MTGCSSQGKIALYAGAFDEQFALVIAEAPATTNTAIAKSAYDTDLKKWITWSTPPLL